MHIFITGANGFIGSHLKEYLQQKYDSYQIFAPSSKELNLLDEEAVDNYVHSNKIDVIVHLANRGGGRDTTGMKNVTEYNLRIFFNIIKHEKNVKKIISFGSGAEYGKHKPIINAKEQDYLEQQPNDEYGFYKSITSRYIEKSSNVTQLRVFGAYGENEDYRYRFISNAIIKNLLHLPITINQNVYFDYIYINDLIRMTDWFIHNDHKYNIYNVTTGQKVDLVTLAQTINKVSDYKSEIYVLNEGFNNEYSSDNSRVLSELGDDFEFTSHENAIMNMRQFFMKNIESLDKEVIVEDPYLKKIEKMWE